jgi:hypothetical protein
VASSPKEPLVDPDNPGTGPSPWSPPDAGRPSPPPPPSDPRVETDTADGPPLPPPLRQRRRRRRIALAVIAVVAIIAIPVGLGLAGAGFLTLDPTDGGLAADGGAGGDVGDDGATDEPDDGIDGEDEGDGEGDEPDSPIGDRPGVSPSLDAPDPSGLSGVDAVYATLLTDVDRSERVMIGFQDEIGEAFGSAGTDDDLVGTLQAIAAERRDALLEVRADLVDELDDGGAELVRERYLLHLDSWADYMDAVADDPQVLAGDGTDGGFTVVINQTADAFRRALDEQLPLDVDGEVQDFAEGILDRGFRSSGDAQV